MFPNFFLHLTTLPRNAEVGHYMLRLFLLKMPGTWDEKANYCHLKLDLLLFSQFRLHNLPT
jgi:hypothetical protein